VIQCVATNKLVNYPFFSLDWMDGLTDLLQWYLTSELLGNNQLSNLLVAGTENLNWIGLELNFELLLDFLSSNWS